MTKQEKLILGSILTGKLIHQGMMKMMPVEEQKSIISILYKVGIFSYVRSEQALHCLEKDYEIWVEFLKQIPDVTTLIEELDNE